MSPWADGVWGLKIRNDSGGERGVKNFVTMTV